MSPFFPEQSKLHDEADHAGFENPLRSFQQLQLKTDVSTISQPKKQAVNIGEYCLISTVARQEWTLHSQHLLQYYTTIVSLMDR